MRNNQDVVRGFTLIEILVVVLIIGITIGFALLAFGDFGNNRRIVMAAEQFVNYVKLVQQQAILETSTLGISVGQNGYQVLRFKSSNNWQSISKPSIFHQQHFPNHTLILLDTPIRRNRGPQIIIHSSGDMTPFTLNFSSINQANIAHVVGEQNGNISLKLLKSS